MSEWPSPMARITIVLRLTKWVKFVVVWLFVLLFLYGFRPVLAEIHREYPNEQATSTPTSEPLFYNLPSATLTTPTGLYASPNRSELIVPATIPARQTIYVMGRNATGSHLRVVWNTDVGWIPVSFTDYNGRRDKLAALPIFTREPPACAIPITTQFGLDSTWTSDAEQRIAIVVDLFRSRYGPFPPSFLSLSLNGVEVSTTRQSIVERGQLALKDIVFFLTVHQGDTVGYLLDTSSVEPLTFVTTIFSIPTNCRWNIDSTIIPTPTSTVTRQKVLSTPTPTVTNTPTPTPVTDSTVPPNAIAIPPTASPADVVEIESPPELLVNRSDAIHITLRRTDLLTYLPKPSVTDSIMLTDVVKPVATPDTQLATTFGEGYRLMATAKIEAPDLEIRAVSPLLQPYDTETVTWLFSVSGKKPGRHRLIVSLTIRWLLADSPVTRMKADDVRNSIERQVWHSSFEIVVREPIVRLGSYTVGDIWGFVGGGSLLGAIFGWFANDIKDRVVASRFKRKRPQRSRR